MNIPFAKPFIVGKELFYIAKAVLGGSIQGDGVFSANCHAWLQTNLGCQRALLTHSCTAALEMASILADFRPGDEVIMPSFTFVSTANAFVLRGGVPVFVDIRPDTLNIDESLIEAAITPKTRAIVPVHYAGVACAMDEIMEIAERHGLLVIEDAAQALLARYRDRSLGGIGHFGCLSFHESKNIISGEGGALLINDKRFIERAEIIREKGTNRSKLLRGEVDKYTWVDVGSSYLPSELTAAFLYAQFERADEINSKRRFLANIYREKLAPIANSGRIALPCSDYANESNGHIFYILVADLAERSALIEYLGKRGARAVFHYVPLHSSPAGVRYGRVSGAMITTNSIGDRLVRLPLFFEMSESEVAIVAEAIIDFYR